MAFEHVRFLQETFREADEARKPREQLWRDAWNVYHNSFDYSKKAPWQTKLRWSRFPGTVENAAAILKRALVEARQWYTVEGEGEDDKARAPLIKRLTDLWLRLANFVPLFADAVKLGGVVDIIPMKLTWPIWEEEELVLSQPTDLLAGLGPIAEPRPIMQKRRRAGLKVELVDPFRFWIDPTGRNRYVIEDTWTDLDELKHMVRLAPEVWDAEAVGVLEAASEKAVLDFEMRARQGLASSGDAPWRKPVKLRTYWGDVVDDVGRVVGRDQTFAVANETLLVGKPRAIPFWHKTIDRRLPNKRGPFVWGSLFRIPLSPYGKGFAYDSLDLARFLTDQANAVGDQLLFSGLNAFEVDLGLIENPEQFADGVYPGKTFYKRDAAGRPLIEPRLLGQINPQALAVMGMYDRTYQNSTGVIDYISSAQPTRQETSTLGEYQGRQSQALGLMDMIARNLEDQLLEPVLETAYWLILQYMDDFEAAPVLEALGPAAQVLGAMSDAERFGLLKASVRFQARGISVVLAKSEELRKVATFIQGLPMLQQVMPNLAQQINGEAILRKVVEGLQWDPDEILRKPQEVAVEQEAMAGQPGTAIVPGTAGTPGNGQADIAALMQALGGGR